MCEICKNWARDGHDSLEIGGKILIPNHNPNCPRYNDSLIDVWKMTVNSSSCYFDNEQDLISAQQEEFEDETVIVKEKMHREVFDNIPEFDGF